MKNSIKFNQQTDVCSLTDKGLVRKENEDNLGYIETQNGHLFVVCDGMGGHVGGRIASTIAVESIVTFFNEQKYDNLYKALENALQYANSRIYEKAAANRELKGMGTTATVVLINDNEIFYAHVGDSRIYIKSQNELYRLTKDHSFVQNLVDAGIILESEAEKHPRKNEILMALGIKPEIKPEICSEPIHPTTGDIIMLCTDGLCGFVSDTTMKNILNSSKGIHQKGAELLQMALNAGGHDNITVQLINISESNYRQSKFAPVQAPKMQPNTNNSTENDYDEHTQTLDIENVETKNVSGSKFNNKIIYIAIAAITIVIILGIIIFAPDEKQQYFVVTYQNNINTDSIEQNNLDSATILAERKINYTTSAKIYEIIDDTFKIVKELNVLPEPKCDLPKDTIYTVQAGEVWSILYDKFKVCKCFILNHPDNENIFKERKHPVKNDIITIPLQYSGDKTTNPNRYEFYTIEITGDSCQNLNENCEYSEEQKKKIAIIEKERKEALNKELEHKRLIDEAKKKKNSDSIARSKKIEKELSEIEQNMEDANRIKEQRKVLISEINKVNKEIESTESEKKIAEIQKTTDSTALSNTINPWKKKGLEAKINNQRKQIDSLSNRITILNTELATKNKELENLK